MDRENRVAFTGHRTYSREYDKELHDILCKLYERGYRIFMSGMAVGFDLSAAEAVVKLKDIYPGVELNCIVPFKGQQMRFSDADKQRYARVIGCASEVVVLSESYSPGCYLHRNDYLVDNSSLIIAYYDGSKGGTHYTVRRARREKSEVVNIYKSPQQTLF